MWRGAWKKRTSKGHQKASANAIKRFYNNLTARCGAALLPSAALGYQAGAGLLGNSAIWAPQKAKTPA
jgi:hypothetical protein